MNILCLSSKIASQKLRIWEYAYFFARKLISMAPDPGKASWTLKIEFLTLKVILLNRHDMKAR